MTTQRYKLCILDDDTHLLQVLARRLTAVGFEVTTVADACQPEQLIAMASDIYLLDLRFGHQSGMHFIQPLRHALPQCRIVVMTGYASIATAVQAVKAGADDYLTKPVDFQVLRQTLLPFTTPVLQQTPEQAHPTPACAAGFAMSYTSNNKQGDNVVANTQVTTPQLSATAEAATALAAMALTAPTQAQPNISNTALALATPTLSPRYDLVDAQDEPARLMSAEQIEWEHIQRVLLAQDGNISQTARLLGMHRRTLQRKLLKHRPQ